MYLNYLVSPRHNLQDSLAEYLGETRALIMVSHTAFHPPVVNTANLPIYTVSLFSTFGLCHNYHSSSSAMFRSTCEASSIHHLDYDLYKLQKISLHQSLWTNKRLEKAGFTFWSKEFVVVGLPSNHLINGDWMEERSGGLSTPKFSIIQQAQQKYLQYFYDVARKCLVPPSLSYNRKESWTDSLN